MTNGNEAFSRVVIDAQLADQGWSTQDPNGVRYEYVLPDGTRADYVLCDRYGRSAAVKGLRALTAEALGRLGVESAPTRFEQAYNSGQTTQAPAGRVVAIRGRIRRKIGYSGIFLSFERG